MNRRQFAFWFGFGLFGLADRLRVYGFDELAAAAMRATEPSSTPTRSRLSAETTATATPVHWTAAENKNWRWFEREDFVDGQWKLTGITTPVHKQTKKLNEGPGYLQESVVPEPVRLGKKTELTELPPEVMIASQQRMFQRRNVVQRPCDIQLIQDMYEQTRDERQLAGEPLSL